MVSQGYLLIPGKLELQFPRADLGTETKLKVNTVTVNITAKLGFFKMKKIYFKRKYH